MSELVAHQTQWIRDPLALRTSARFLKRRVMLILTEPYFWTETHAAATNYPTVDLAILLWDFEC
jgi:hypothetical protein